MASEYGWSKHDIFEDVYLDELFKLVDGINVRRIGEYKLQLAIVSNPHAKEPKKLWQILEAQEKEIKGPRTEKMDVAGMKILKHKLRQSPRFEVK